MSVRVMTWVWDSALPSMERFVALAYADHADDQGNNIYPSLNTVARKTGISRRRVISIRQRLEARGVLVPTRTIHNKPTKFRIDKAALEAVTGDAASPVEIDELVTLCHPASDATSPELVTQRHLTSDTVSPEPSINHQYEPSLNRQGRDGAHAPPPSAANAAIVIPDALKNQPAPPRKTRAPKLSPANITASDDPRIATYLEHLRSEITQSNAALICERVKLEYLDAWIETCKEWAYGNGDASWNPTNFAGMFERFERKLTSRRAKANGHQPQSQTQPQQFGIGGELYRAAVAAGFDLGELQSEASIGN